MRVILQLEARHHVICVSDEKRPPLQPSTLVRAWTLNPRTSASGRRLAWVVGLVEDVL
jgi:hypothetical protein